MSFNKIVDQVGKFVANNSPTILTTIGVTGSLTAAYLAGKASFKAAEILRYEEEIVRVEESRSLEPKEKIELVWKLYIPAVSTSALTVICIIAANRIGTRRTAALAAAYALSEQAINEYKAKVVEKIGIAKERNVRDELAQDRVNKTPVNSREVIITDGGDVLCHDAFSGRYFKSDMESLRRAQNDLNYKINNDYSATLTDFYNLIGLPATSISDDIGWTSDSLFDLEFSTVLSTDGKPCISIEFKTSPLWTSGRIR